MDKARSNWKLVAVVAVGLLVVAVMLGGIWGEAHYGNCIKSAEARYPVAFQPAGENAGQYGGGPEAEFVFSPNQNARDAALSSCSHWP